MHIGCLLLIVSTVATLNAIPVPAKNAKETNNRVLYDQRQEGEWNVRADLKNFVILIIPPSRSSVPSTTVGPSSDLYSSFFDFDSSKTVMVPLVASNAKEQSAAEETKHFIESKTAPYHVDISAAHDGLTKLYPNVKGEEELVAKSPSVALFKDLIRPVVQEAGKRGARAFVLTVPSDAGKKFFAEVAEDKRSSKKEIKKKTIKEAPKEVLKLLGAENEQCGPDMARDSYGNCKPINQY